MVLVWSGREIETPTGANRLGHDADNNRVVVSGSHEAIADYGWNAIWEAAETKYSNGVYEQTGETRMVRVTKADCETEDDS